MQYPVTVVLNKAIADIESYAKTIAKSYGLTEDLLSVVLDTVSSHVKSSAIDIYSNMVIESFNAIEKLNTEVSELKKEEPTTEVKEE